MSIIAIPTLSETVQLFTILSVIILAVWAVLRSKTPQLLRGELIIWREKCERLERDNHNLIKAGYLRDMEIKELKNKTDLQAVIEVQNSMHQQFIDHSVAVMANHKQLFELVGGIVNSQKGITVILERISAKLLATSPI